MMVRTPLLGLVLVASFFERAFHFLAFLCVLINVIQKKPICRRHMHRVAVLTIASWTLNFTRRMPSAG